MSESDVGDRPKRIQRSRAKGWRMPDGAVYVGRPTRWGNPFSWHHHGIEIGNPAWARGVAVDMYRRSISAWPFSWDVCEQWENAGGRAEWLTELASGIALRPLSGRDLACWCPLDQPCHADVLLALANVATPPEPAP